MTHRPAAAALYDEEEMEAEGEEEEQGVGVVGWRELSELEAGLEPADEMVNGAVMGGSGVGSRDAGPVAAQNMHPESSTPGAHGSGESAGSLAVAVVGGSSTHNQHLLPSGRQYRRRAS